MKSSFEGFPSPRPNGGGMKTGDATAAAADILIAKTAYGPLGKIVGTMPENGALNYNPSTAAQNIPAGHTSGGTVNPVTGSAAVGDVKSGQGFSSGSGIGQVGTMPVIGIDTVGGAVSGVAGRIYVRPSAAYWNGTYFTFFDDPDFIAANIPNGMSMFGLVGTGTNAKMYATGSTANSGILTFTLDSGGTGNYNSLVVSGLNFPNGINFIRLNGSGFPAFCEYSANILYNTSNILMGNTGAIQHMRATSPAAISTTGFTLPVMASGTYTWEAWGI